MAESNYQRYTNYWDIFRKDVLEKRSERKSSLADNIFKGLKLIVYSILFLVVFCGTIVSRASLQILTDRFYQESRTNYKTNLEKDAISYFLLFIISIPDGIKLILSLLQFLYRKRDSPSWTQLRIVIVKECLHFFSLGTIVFKVLPLLNAVEVCTYLSGTPLVPSILHSISYTDKCSFSGRHAYKRVLNIISIISQAAAVFAVPIYKVINNQISNIDTFLMVFCSICVSVRWLETYFEYVAEILEKDEDSQTVSSLVASFSRLLLAVILFPTFFAQGVASPVETFSSRPSFLSSTAIPTLCINLSMNTTCELQSMNTTSEPQHMNPTSELQSTKTTVELKPMNTTSELQFINTTSEPQYMNTSSELQSTNTTGELKSMDTTSELQSMDTTNELQNTTFFPSYIQSSKKYVDDWLLNLFLIHFFTSIVLFYGAVISIRLCMDRVSFCTALTFGTPIYVTGVVVAYIVNGPNWISNTLMSKQVTDTEVYFMLLMFLTAWLSQLWTCRHIWFSSHDRMAFVGRLFVLPHYCSPVADLSILHSRRQQSNNNVKADPVQTKVYICATMWHENRTEMKQFLKTLFRLDLDQAAHYLAKNEPGNETSEQNREAAIRDYYEFEAHIMFDDAMETTKRKDNGEKKREPNEFVQQLMEIISDAGMAVHRKSVNLAPPEKKVTPYGGRMVWKLPGSNTLVVHLKDKEKIRHKKRWSQIMYLYYLIGYKLVNNHMQSIKEEVNRDFNLVKELPDSLVQQAKNTYVMALDGDVDFSPEALQLLIDRMKKNPTVGATCGRIKPGGTGPVVWYQKFEYAIGHWLQKSAEHVLGCVLCGPGCFSLFRASALMDDNIMRTYAKLPTEPKHYLQYDQGEDRWLCTLMLQQGHRIEYCAAAEAFTFAPEEFREFFNQRKRWMPSTMANNLDLLMSYDRTTRKNDNISYLYIFYLVVLFLSSVLGPSTVLLAMQSAVRTVFNTSAVVAYLLTYGPAILFIFICLKFQSHTQLTIAMILSAIYAMLMMAVTVGTIENISEEGFFIQSAVFMYVLVGVFLIAGLFHPHELTDLFFGVLYFICIPAGYLFLNIYAICNLNNVSWGTRETQKAVLECQTQGTKKKKKTEAELGMVSGEVIDDILQQVKSSKIKETSCLDFIPSIFQWINNMIILRSLESMVSIFKNTAVDEGIVDPDGRSVIQKSMGRTFTKVVFDENIAIDENSWAEEHGTRNHLSEEETLFWNELIVKYLQPLIPDETKEKAVAESMKDFRNKVAFAFFFINGLWLVIMTAMNEVKNVLNISIQTIDGITIIIEPLGLLFIVIFALLLFIQFVGMIRHRYGTFLQLLGATNLRNKYIDPEDVIRRIKDLISKSTDQDCVDQSNSSSNTEETDNNQINLATTIKSRISGNFPLDLKETYRRHAREKQQDNADVREESV